MVILIRISCRLTDMYIHVYLYTHLLIYVCACTMMYHQPPKKYRTWKSIRNSLILSKQTVFMKKTPRIIYVHMIIDICWYLIWNVYLCLYYFWRPTNTYHIPSYTIHVAMTVDPVRWAPLNANVHRRLIHIYWASWRRTIFGATEERGEMEKN